MSGGSASPRPLPRRAFVLKVARAAGVAPAVLAFLEGKGEAFPRGEETDLSILYAALTIEHHAIALYDAGLRAALFPAGLKSHAVEFRGDHLGHRDTQIAVVEERGGRPPAALAHYGFRFRGADDLIAQALEIEIAAQEAYTALISQIRTKDYLLSAAFILVDEVRHMTVWKRVMGLKIY